MNENRVLLGTNTTMLRPYYEEHGEAEKFQYKQLETQFPSILQPSFSDNFKGSFTLQKDTNPNLLCISMMLVFIMNLIKI